MSVRIDVDRAAAFLGSRLPFVPRLAVVLGSGLGHLVDELENPATVSFEEVPGFPPATVPGHAGAFVAGRLDGAEVLFQRGRYHMYEGHPPDVVGAPVRVAAELGVESLVLTNAAGGVRPSLEPGDLVLLEDHINLMARSPLVGLPEHGETRFPDMSAPYDSELQRLTLAAAAELDVDLERGVYAAVLGPAYETAAEVRMLARLGADVVGMSTVPEVLVARARGLRVLALSLVTNKATGLGGGPLSHEEVVEVGREAGSELGRLLRAVIPRIVAGAQSGSTK
ncbi:MAG TPA: purine-nucleoside phosphorylase [Longimicrobiales bacterium]|nr:purine-nucleoside phosphorylase [Longimicrobiales bacterium]